MGKSKVIYNGQVLIDLTGDTVVASKLLKGYTAHGKDGEVVNGACAYDVDSSGTTATAAEILTGKSAAVKGAVVSGTMKNNGSVTGFINTKAGKFTIPAGYHDGGGLVSIEATEVAKLISENIRQGVTLLGVEGSMTGTEDAVAQSVEVTPSAETQTILPDSTKGYNYLAQVTVKPVPYTETENEAGGITVTIG